MNEQELATAVAGVATQLNSNVIGVVLVLHTDGVNGTVVMTHDPMYPHDEIVEVIQQSFAQDHATLSVVPEPLVSEPRESN